MDSVDKQAMLEKIEAELAKLDAEDAAAKAEAEEWEDEEWDA